MPVYVFECRYPDGTNEIWRESYTGSVPLAAGREVEIDGRGWRVVETSATEETIKVVLEESPRGRRAMPPV
jgi:hypothetical protein